jgi:hypothetical protein
MTMYRILLLLLIVSCATKKPKHVWLPDVPNGGIIFIPKGDTASFSGNKISIKRGSPWKRRFEPEPIRPEQFKYCATCKGRWYSADNIHVCFGPPDTSWFKPILKHSEIKAPKKCKHIWVEEYDGSRNQVVCIKCYKRKTVLWTYRGDYIGTDSSETLQITYDPKTGKLTWADTTLTHTPIFPYDTKSN